MKKIMVGLVLLGLVLASAAVAAAAPPPTTATTTTTTTLPPPPPPTRGFVRCPDHGDSAWSEWVQMGSHTTVLFNIGVVRGDLTGYPVLDIDQSVDGASAESHGPVSYQSELSATLTFKFTSAWPYLRFRCRNQYAGIPALVWALD